MVLTTKDFGNEIQWSLSENCSSDYTYDDYYDEIGYADNQDHVKHCCVTDGIYNVVCRDHGNDGWHGGYLTINGTRFCDDWGEYEDDQISTAVTIRGTKLDGIELFAIDSFIVKHFCPEKIPLNI